MPGSSVSCVSTTVPTCTDRTEVAPKITPSVRACDTKRVRAQHFIRRRAAAGSPAALLCVSSEVSHCAGQVVLEGLHPPLRILSPKARPTPTGNLQASTGAPVDLEHAVSPAEPDDASRERAQGKSDDRRALFLQLSDRVIEHWTK